MFSDINRNIDDALDRQNYKEKLKENNYDNYNQVIAMLINYDKKVKKLLNLVDDSNKLIKKKD